MIEIPQLRRGKRTHHPAAPASLPKQTDGCRLLQMDVFVRCFVLLLPSGRRSARMEAVLAPEAAAATAAS